MIVDALVIAGPNRFRRGQELPEAIDAAVACGIEGSSRRRSSARLPPRAGERAPRRVGPGVSFPIARLGRIDPLGGSASRRRRPAAASATSAAPGCSCTPVRRPIRSRESAAVVEVAAEAGAPVVIATGTYALSEPLQVMELAAAHPTVRSCMTSGGQINISGLGMLDAWLALQRAPNLHVLTNGEYRAGLHRATRPRPRSAPADVCVVQPVLRLCSTSAAASPVPVSITTCGDSSRARTPGRCSASFRRHDDAATVPPHSKEHDDDTCR